MNCDYSQPSLPTGCLRVIVQSGGGGSLVPAVIAAMVALSVVVLAETLTRHRSRRERLEEATYAFLDSEIGLMSLLLTTPPSHGLSFMEAMRLPITGISRVRMLARWPIREAKEIRAEADAIAVRLSVAMMAWSSGRLEQREPGLIVGGRLSTLVFGDEGGVKRAELNDALEARGLLPPSEADDG